MGNTAKNDFIIILYYSKNIKTSTKQEKCNLETELYINEMWIDQIIIIIISYFENVCMYVYIYI